jgi:hypothetical protein
MVVAEFKRARQPYITFPSILHTLLHRVFTTGMLRRVLTKIIVTSLMQCRLFSLWSLPRETGTRFMGLGVALPYAAFLCMRNVALELHCDVDLHS